MFGGIVRVRSSRGYRISLALGGTVLLLATGKLLIAQSGPEEPASALGGGVREADSGAGSSIDASIQGSSVSDDGGYAGYAAPPPTSLSMVTAKAELVVQGRLERELGTRTIVFGQSSPLGEAQVVRPITLEVRSFELMVERYVVGSGPQTLVLHKSLGGPQPRVGDAGMFFLRRPTEWKLDGYGTTRGIHSIFLEPAPAVITFGDRRTPVPFLAGRTLTDVEADVTALMSR